MALVAGMLQAETPEGSRMNGSPHDHLPHMTDPHHGLRQSYRHEIHLLEEADNIEPEERERRIQHIQRRLQHFDDVERHHREMLMWRREHEREQVDRFRPRDEITAAPKSEAVRRDLKRRKEEYARIRARNGQDTREVMAALRKRNGRDAGRKSSWMEFGAIGLVLGIIALAIGANLVSNAWMGVKAYVVYRKASVAYENKYGNFHSCAFCGRTRLPTHAIYHSVFRRTAVRLREYNIDRCGFAVYSCDKCLWGHRLRHFLGLTMIGTGYTACLYLVARVGFWGLVFGFGRGIEANSPLLVFIVCVVCPFVVLVGTLFTLMACYHSLLRRFLPWRKLIEQHSAVAELLKKGYEVDESWPRLVREDLDTEKRLRTLERPAFKYQTNVEHETYCWIGALQDFNSGGWREPRSAESLRWLREREKRRCAACTAKDISLQRATKGILTIILVALIYVIAKFLKL